MLGETALQSKSHFGDQMQTIMLGLLQEQYGNTQIKSVIPRKGNQNVLKHLLVAQLSTYSCTGLTDFNYRARSFLLFPQHFRKSPSDFMNEYINALYIALDRTQLTKSCTLQSQHLQFLPGIRVVVNINSCSDFWLWCTATGSTRRSTVCCPQGIFPFCLFVWVLRHAVKSLVSYKGKKFWYY